MCLIFKNIGIYEWIDYKAQFYIKIKLFSKINQLK